MLEIPLQSELSLGILNFYFYQAEKVLNDFLSHLYSKRKQILTIRGFRKIPRLDHSNVKVKADHLVN